MKTIGDYWEYLTPEEKQFLAEFTKDRIYSTNHSVATLPFARLDEFTAVWGFSVKSSILGKKLRAMRNNDYYTLDKLMEGKDEKVPATGTCQADDLRGGVGGTNPA